MCRDQLTGCKRLFETSTENLGTEDFNCDKAGHLSLAQDLTDNLSTDQPSDSCHQVCQLTAVGVFPDARVTIMY